MEAALSKAAPDCCFKHVSANFGCYTVKGLIWVFFCIFCLSNASTAYILQHQDDN